MAKKVVFAGVALLAVSVGIWTYLWANSPAQTSISSTSSQQVQGSQITLAPYTAQQFTTVIPSTLQVKTSTENNKSAILGQYLFTNKDSHLSDQVGITVGTMQGTDINEVSAAKLRQTQQDVYESATLDFTPSNAVAFHKKDGYETSVIWSEGSRYVAVVVSGSVLRQAELEEISRVVVTNWQWR